MGELVGDGSMEVKVDEIVGEPLLVDIILVTSIVVTSGSITVSPPFWYLISCTNKLHMIVSVTLLFQHSVVLTVTFPDDSDSKQLYRIKQYGIQTKHTVPLG